MSTATRWTRPRFSSKFKCRIPHFSTGLNPLLASVDFQSPILWAIIIGWILSVTLHELAHGVVAFLGGDYTIRERGGLTLNPFKYMDPVVSIILPLFFLLMGGVPLPGGVTYVRRDLLRSKLWETAVSLAGPATNFVLFLLCVLPFHNRFGWIHPPPLVAEWTPTQLFWQPWPSCNSKSASSI